MWPFRKTAGASAPAPYAGEPSLARRVITRLTPTVGTSLGRPFAVLVMLEDGTTDPKFVTLSPTEARQLARGLERCAERVFVPGTNSFPPSLEVGATKSVA